MGLTSVIYAEPKVDALINFKRIDRSTDISSFNALKHPLGLRTVLGVPMLFILKDSDLHIRGGIRFHQNSFQAYLMNHRVNDYRPT